jgi:hypothetical protein
MTAGDLQYWYDMERSAMATDRLLNFLALRPNLSISMRVRNKCVEMTLVELDTGDMVKGVAATDFVTTVDALLKGN